MHYEGPGCHPNNSRIAFLGAPRDSIALRLWSSTAFAWISGEERREKMEPVCDVLNIEQAVR